MRYFQHRPLLWTLYLFLYRFSSSFPFFPKRRNSSFIYIFSGGKRASESPDINRSSLTMDIRNIKKLATLNLINFQYWNLNHFIYNSLLTNIINNYSLPTHVRDTIKPTRTDNSSTTWLYLNEHFNRKIPLAHHLLISREASPFLTYFSHTT